MPEHGGRRRLGRRRPVARAAEEARRTAARCPTWEQARACRGGLRAPRERGRPCGARAQAPARRPHRGARAARAAARARRPVARARPLLRGRRRRGDQPALLADRARARPRQGAHARGGRRPPGREPALAASPVRRPQHAPPRARGRQRADLRPRHERAATLRARRALGRRRAGARAHAARRPRWVDAYRALHGYGHREASWTFAQDRGGWRLDHVLVHGLTPVAADYAHDWRRHGLSDHSALVVELER